MYASLGVAMKTIALLSQKGGAGKTLLAVNLAAYATGLGKSVAIVDIDAQSSSCVWGDARGELEELAEITCISCQPNRIEKVIEAASRSGADLVVIDTSPNSENASLQAAKNSDFALVPCRPSLADIKAIKSTISLIQIANVKAGIVLNAVKTKGLAVDATKAVKVYGLPVAPQVIGDRVAFNHAFTNGMGVGEYDSGSKATNEIHLLYTWICSQL